MTAEAPASVNPHYLEHVVATAAANAVEASEDIVAGNGIKLPAKGAASTPARASACSSTSCASRSRTA